MKKRSFNQIHTIDFKVLDLNFRSLSFFLALYVLIVRYIFFEIQKCSCSIYSSDLTK